ncbi:MAG: hypothetical protein P8K80_00440 [Phycisphaerales bacterium]|nr:hypothetical protein [Phycisphaerales bacterium]
MRWSARSRSNTAVLVGLVLGCSSVLLGCHHPVVGKPVIMGASASSGVGVEVPDPKGHGNADPIPLDMEAAYDVVVLAPHAQPLNLASGGHFRDPTASTRSQLHRATEQNPTCIIAIDLLFWSAYQRVADKDRDTEREAQQRLASLEEVLDQLEVIDVPMVLGFVPKIEEERTSLVAANRIPPEKVLEKINGRIATWAESHPNVIMVDFGQFVQAAYTGTPTEIMGRMYSREEMDELIQEDGLHPTAQGLVVLMQLSCRELESRGLIEPEDWQSQIEIAMVELPAKAHAASHDIGLFGMMALKRSMEKINTAFEKEQCDTALAEFDRLLEQFATLSDFPDQWNDIKLAYMSHSFGWDWGPCKAAFIEAHRRQIDRLTPAISVERPNAWKFELWKESQENLNQKTLAIERLIEMQRDLGVLPEPFNDMAASYAGNVMAWKDHPELVRQLLPEDGQALFIANWKVKNWSKLQEKMTLNEGELLHPISASQLKKLKKRWNRSRDEFYRGDDADWESRFLTVYGPEPSSDQMVWADSARPWCSFLNSQYGLALELHAAGEHELARNYLAHCIDLAGPSFYETWRSETIKDPDDHPYPESYTSVKIAPPMYNEIEIWLPLEVHAEAH